MTTSPEDDFESHLTNLGFNVYNELDGSNRNSVGSVRNSVNRHSKRSVDRSSRGMGRTSLDRNSIPVARVSQDSRHSVPAERVSMERRDSDVARDLHAQLNETGQPGVYRESLSRREIEDAELAHAIASEEMHYVEEHARQRQEMLENDRNDYIRPINYKPWFCRVVLLVTCIFMIAEIGVNDWEIEQLSVNPTIGPSVATLEKMGAKVTEKILEGEFYRLFTPIFLHAGILHLLFNMLGLRNVGFPLEREFGPWKIGSIYLVSGIIGVVVSAIMVPQATGVGASGAIFGLFGASWSEFIHNYRLYKGQVMCVLWQLIFATVINLGLGLVPFLDNFAHVGGFLSGLLMGFTMLVHNRYDVFGMRKKRLNYQLFLQALTIAGMPVIFVSLLLTLYLGVDVKTGCSWCSYISCVPMPPGASEENLWWDCHPCSGIVISIVNETANGNYGITCPDSTIASVLGTEADFKGLGISDLRENNALIVQACKEFCY